MRWLLLLAVAACSSKKPHRDDAAKVPPGDAATAEPPRIDAATARVIEMGAFTRACTSDADCVLVDSHPCGHCGCKDTPIAASDLGRFQTVAACTSSDAITFANCIDCDGLTPVCVERQCTSKLTNPPPPGSECASDAECVVSCEREGQCCPPPGCEDVVPRAKAVEVANHNREHCDADERGRCPAARPSAAVTPKCRGGTCYGQYR